MFSDFDARRRGEDGRGRRTVSLLLAGGVFVVLAGALGTAIATAHQIVQRERDVDVEFAAIPTAPEPEPEPEPPPPPPPRSERRPPPAAATSARAPTSIPDARPEEAEGGLAEPGVVGPIDGVVGGEEGGRGRAEAVPEPVAPPPPAPPPGPPRPPRPTPRQERVEVRPPTRIGGCDAPGRPAGLEGATAETIRVRVRVVVGEDGRVLRATVTEGHALVPEALVLGCVETRLYEPATLEGRPVPFVFTYVFTFRPDVL